jgi:ribosomal protein L40E
MADETLQYTEQLEQPPKEGVQSKIIFQDYQKAVLLIIVAGLLYLRLTLRRRKNDKICPNCEARNLYHTTNCSKCSTPLIDLKETKH